MDANVNVEYYVPGSPIFREDGQTPPITPAPPSTPKSYFRGSSTGSSKTNSGCSNANANASSPTNFHAMTVSVTHASQRGGTAVVTTTSQTNATPICYTTTRSAAMMALALGHRPHSPSAATGKNSNSTGCNGAASPQKISSTFTSAVHAHSPLSNAGSPQAPHRSVAPAKAPTAHSNGIALSGGSASSGSDNDGFNNSSSSSSATALRRLYFKSGRKSKLNTTLSTPGACMPLHATGVATAAAAYHTSVSGPLTMTTNASAVPKVVIMGSSTAASVDGTINTSTDSASTLVTSVTHTDTSETCDSLDLGDNSGQSEPLFSSLEEPLLTALHIDDSEQDGTDGGATELELTSCSMYARPDISLQDSTESQESSLSILAAEPSSTTPLLATTSSRRQMQGGGRLPTQSGDKPRTAPAPTSARKHFTFDAPQSPKSARSSEKSRSHFSFKDQQQQQQQQKQPPKQARRNMDVERAGWAERGDWDERGMAPARRDISPTNRTKYRPQQRSSFYYDRDRNDYEQEISTPPNNGDGGARGKKSNAPRNRYVSTGADGGGVATANAKRGEPRRRSPASAKINAAPPPTMKESHFFGTSAASQRPKQLSPSAPHPTAAQRKYSSSSSSGGSERDRERQKDGGTMFPFDRERIQRECFAVDENSSSATASSDSDEAEAHSVYERKLSVHHGSPKSSDVFQHYTLLSQYDHHAPMGGGGGGGGGGGNSGPPSRKNSKRLRANSVIHTTIRENQQYVPHTDAFYPQPKASSASPSPGEHSYTQHSPKSHADLNKFDEIASKFDQIPPKTYGSTASLASKKSSPGGCGNDVLQLTTNGGGGGVCGNSPTGSMRGGQTTSPSPPSPTQLPNLRIDFFSESQMRPRTKSFKSGTNGLTSAAHDMLDECQRGGGGGGGGGGAAGSINVTSNPLEAAVCTIPRATIVVQQPSLSLDSTVETVLIKSEVDFISVEQGKDALARKRNSQQLQHQPHHHQPSQQQQHHHLHQTPSSASSSTAASQQQKQQKRDENMRQLLDVTNTLTFEELRDFEMRYGSPHHSRSQSVKTPGSRASGRPNQLCLPQQRSRVASMPNTGVEQEYYRLRHFSITGKGVVNRGDSLKSRRSRSNNSVASSNSSTEHLTATQIPAPNSAHTSATCSLASSRESSTSNPGNGPYRVLMLGGTAVGKSSLVSQFMTSEYLHAYDTSIDDESGEKAVSVLLSGEESELIFIDHSYTEMAPDDCLSSYDPHGYCVIYSAADRSSFTVAEHVLQVLWTNQNIAQKAVILVANKADLARSRLVTTEEGKAMATAYDCKFIETSVGINHNVDELLVGLLSQIRLKLENPEKSRDLFRKRSIRKSKRRACSPLSGACLNAGTHPNTPLGPVNNVALDANSTPPGSAQSSPRKYRGSRTSTSLKVKGLLGRVWARDSKSKSCENLHVL